MSNGVGDELTQALLGRVCATLIHVSTVEHDILNNVVWDHTTLGSVTPTVVPLTGEPMDQRRSFDLLATLIGTWKPYNMLLTADVPQLALDAQAASVMARPDRKPVASAGRTGHPAARSLAHLSGEPQPQHLELDRSCLRRDMANPAEAALPAGQNTASQNADCRYQIGPSASEATSNHAVCGVRGPDLPPPRSCPADGGKTHLASGRITCKSGR